MSQIIQGILGISRNDCPLAVNGDFGPEKMNVPSKVLIILGRHRDTHSHSFLCLIFVGQYALVPK